MKQKSRFIMLVIIAFIAASSFSYAQKNSDTFYSSSEVIKELGYYWKLDSFANNGFRRYTYEKILKSRIDSITKDFLLDQLGNPNRVWKQQFGNGEIYVYHIFDISKMPKNYDAPLSCIYIGFLFNLESGYLISIKEGDIDM
jgi:hypothetical protein